MQRIGARLERDGRVAFTEFFEGTNERPRLVGVFLAVLELVRHQHARATQPELFGEIWIEPGDEPLPAVFEAIESDEIGSTGRAAA
jgi:segregation and condensation protein A